MPMMIVCDKLAYIPGQIVTGQVVIISKSPQKVKGLTMRFIGRSSRLLGEIEGTKRYKKEVYFDEKIDIFGHDGSNTQLRVGETLYPFTFPLPPGLPSSFEWPDGNVLYFVEAKLTRASWKDKRVSSRIQVEGVYDLNLDSSVMNSVEVKRQKYVKHLLSKSGPYGFTFRCSRSAFVRGHSLPFSVEIRNLSKVDSRKLKVSLLQEVKLGDGKSVATLIEHIKGPAVPSGEVVTWEARLKVPGGIPPTNLGNILNYPVVIHVLYFVHAQLSLRNCREDPICIKVPVTIGTISLHRQRALSVPSLDDGNGSPFYPLANNGHRIDCPMSQLILPSAALSTSQFSPHLVSVNTATSYTHTQASRGHSYNPHLHHTVTRSNRPPPVQILGPVRQYEYYFEYEDSAGSTRSVTSRGDSLFQRRRNQNNHEFNRRSRQILPYTDHAYPVAESPPPSYDEIFTRERVSEATGSMMNSNDNDNDRVNLRNTEQEMVHKPLSTQMSSSSEDEDSTSLLMPLSNEGSVDRSGSSSGSETPTSCNTEDDTGSEDVSANDDFFTSRSGSSTSSICCEDLKCHDLRYTAELDDKDHTSVHANSYEQVSIGRSHTNVQGCSGKLSREHETKKSNVICDSDDES